MQKQQIQSSTSWISAQHPWYMVSLLMRIFTKESRTYPTSRYLVWLHMHKFPMKSYQSLIQSRRNVSSYGTCSNKRGISLITLLPKKFEWVETLYKLEPTLFEPITIDLDIDSEEEDHLRLTPKESPIMTRLSGPHDPPRNQSTSRLSPRLDKGKAKRPEYEDDQSYDNESACTHSILSMVD